MGDAWNGSRRRLVQPREVGGAPFERPRPLHLAWRRAGVRAERRYELRVSEVLAVPGLQGAVGEVGERARGGVGVLAVGGWPLLVSGDRLVPVGCDSAEGVRGRPVRIVEAGP